MSMQVEELEQKSEVDDEQISWGKIFMTAQKHAVLPLLYDVLQEYPVVPQREKEILEGMSRQTVQQSYHLSFLTTYLVELFEANEIAIIVLKGSGTAALYPVPELRKSGDIDLLLPEIEDFEKAKQVLQQHGFIPEKDQRSQHHYAYTSKDGITLELHNQIAGPFDNEKTNRMLAEIQKECKEHYHKKEAMGFNLPILDEPYHAYYLLLHMLQHFLRSGFGLKLLCDWVVFWKRPLTQADKDSFLELVSRTGLIGFARLITLTCTGYLGLKEEQVEFLLVERLPDEVVKSFMREVLEAQEFGKSSTDRMVVVRGKGIGGYLREFHHQMQENYPQAKDKKWIWPYYWIKTFFVFVDNNRKIRKVSIWKVLKNAKKRSNIVIHLGLFK